MGELLTTGGAGACTASASVAACVHVPEVPVNVSVELPIAALASALNAKFCAVPGLSVRDAGLAVTPTGSPVTSTETGETKPFVPEACKESDVPVVP